MPSAALFSIRITVPTELDLTVRADNEYQLKQMRYVYSERPEVVFKGIIALLTGEVNYLFDKD